MKTSLIIDDLLFKEAKKESNKTGKTISEIISSWAKLGKDAWTQNKHKQRKDFKPLNLGTPNFDLLNRKAWMAELDGENR